jgi:hypothetical protein
LSGAEARADGMGAPSPAPALTAARRENGSGRRASCTRRAPAVVGRLAPTCAPPGAPASNADAVGSWRTPGARDASAPPPGAGSAGSAPGVCAARVSFAIVVDEMTDRHDVESPRQHTRIRAAHRPKAPHAAIPRGAACRRRIS